MSEKDWKPEFHNGLYRGDLSDEEWREYEWNYYMGDIMHSRIYRIEKPKYVFWRDGGTTHRVVDNDGVAHCIPAPGQMGCALRWKNISGDNVNW